MEEKREKSQEKKREIEEKKRLRKQKKRKQVPQDIDENVCKLCLVPYELLPWVMCDRCKWWIHIDSFQLV